MRVLLDPSIIKKISFHLFIDHRPRKWNSTGGEPRLCLQCHERHLKAQSQALLVTVIIEQKPQSLGTRDLGDFRVRKAHRSGRRRRPTVTRPANRGMTDDEPRSHPPSPFFFFNFFFFSSTYTILRGLRLSARNRLYLVVCRRGVATLRIKEV